MRTAPRTGMQRITDALELLTAQHDEIGALLAEVAAAKNAAHRSVLVTELADKLTVHLAVEQEMFYPALSPLITPEVRDELIAEHAEIKRVLADLLWLETEDTRLARKLVTLKTLIDNHSVWQERELFESIAERVPSDDLAALGKQIHHWIDSTIAAAA